MRSVKYLFIILIVVSCSKDDLPKIDCAAKTNRIEDIKKLMVGSYDWTYTKVNYQSGSAIETPLSTGLRYKYVFKANGQVDYFQNDTLQWSDDYLIDYEFKVTTYAPDSSTVIIINDKQTGQREEFFRPYLCNDSAKFYNPYNSVDFQRYFKRS